MATKASTRFWRTHKAAGRPIPRFCDDDVTDYMVMEAIMLKVQKEDADARKQQERDQWKKAAKEKGSDLDAMR